MFSVPYSTYDMNAYLMSGDYLSGLGSSNTTYNASLAVPKMQTLHMDSFNAHTAQKDKRHINLTYVGLWFAGIVATVLGGAKCIAKVSELAKDTVATTASNIKYDAKSAKNKLCDIGSVALRCLNPKNWFKK